MTRLILFLLIVVLLYWLVTNVIRGFLRGLGLGNEKVRPGRGGVQKRDYKDVQDADFEDITDEK